VNDAAGVIDHTVGGTTTDDDSLAQLSEAQRLLAMLHDPGLELQERVNRLQSSRAKLVRKPSSAARLLEFTTLQDNIKDLRRHLQNLVQGAASEPDYAAMHRKETMAYDARIAESATRGGGRGKRRNRGDRDKGRATTVERRYRRKERYRRRADVGSRYIHKEIAKSSIAAVVYSTFCSAVGSEGLPLYKVMGLVRAGLSHDTAAVVQSLDTVLVRDYIFAALPDSYSYNTTDLWVSGIMIIDGGRSIDYRWGRQTAVAQSGLALTLAASGGDVLTILAFAVAAAALTTLATFASTTRTAVAAVPSTLAGAAFSTLSCMSLQYKRTREFVAPHASC
jgi:hypothetical protein